MPPPTSDNQGLKIAVAMFATLSVLLGVATYFGFAEASKNGEALAKAQSELGSAKKLQGDLQGRLNELKDLAGFGKTDETLLKTAIAEEQKKIAARVQGIAEKAQQVFANVKSAGGFEKGDPFLDSLRSNAESLEQEPNKTLASSLDRMAELLDQQSQLLAHLSGDYVSTRKDLEAANQIAQQKVDEVGRTLEKSEADRIGEMEKHEADRKSVMSRLDELQSRNQQLATEAATLKGQLAQANDEWRRRYELLRQQFLAVRQQIEKEAAPRGRGGSGSRGKPLERGRGGKTVAVLPAQARLTRGRW